MQNKRYYNPLRLLVFGEGGDLLQLDFDRYEIEYTTDELWHKAGTEKFFYYKDTANKTTAFGKQSWAVGQNMFVTSMTSQARWSLTSPTGSWIQCSFSCTSILAAYEFDETTIIGNLMVMSSSGINRFQYTGNPENYLTGTHTMAASVYPAISENIEMIILQNDFDIECSGSTPKPPIETWDFTSNATKYL